MVRNGNSRPAEVASRGQAGEMRTLTHLFFDLGDTLVDLGGLLPAMEQELQERFPELGSHARKVATIWITRTAEATPKAQGPAYRPGLRIAGEALSNSLSEAAITLGTDPAMELVKSAWSRYLMHPSLCCDVTREL